VLTGDFNITRGPHETTSEVDCSIWETEGFDILLKLLDLHDHPGAGLFFTWFNK
jgi:hypothetical protein